MVKCPMNCAVAIFAKVQAKVLSFFFAKHRLYVASIVHLFGYQMVKG